MNKYVKKSSLLFLLLLLAALIPIVSTSICLGSISAAFASELTDMYGIRIHLVDGGYLYVDSTGVSTNPQSKISKGQSLSISTIKADFLDSGGFAEGKIFNDFYFDNNIFGWATYNVPDLSSYTKQNGYINITPSYNNEVHTIKYYSDESNVYQSKSGVVGIDIQVSAPTKKGHNFVLWNIKDTSTEFSETQMQDLTPTTEGNQTLEVEAKWEAKSTSIVFESNGGSAHSSLTNITYGSTLTDIPIPTKKGYDFRGWYANSALTGASYVNGIIWDQDKASESSPTITLYAKWELAEYTINFDINGGNNPVSIIKYTITTDSFTLPTIEKNGLDNRGWVNTNTNLVITEIEKGSVGNLNLRANWLTNIPITTGESKTISSKYALLDFTNLSTNVNSVYYMENNVNDVVIKGASYKEYINLRFEIKDRITPIKITLWNIDFKAHNNETAIFAQDADLAQIKKINGNYGLVISGDTEIDLIVKGSSYVRGGTRTYYNLNEDASLPDRYCSALISYEVNIQQDSTAYLYLYGGDGANGTSKKDDSISGNNTIPDRDGRPGGTAFFANYLTSNIYRLRVYGGDGGNGANGIQGATGANGTASSTAGKTGGNGYDGGKGGDGRYGLYISHNITVSYGRIYSYGGDGGTGGNGGKGGTGGKGMDGAFLRWTGVGGNGGKGGYSGAGGLGYDATKTMATITGEIYGEYDGNDGERGNKGAGGTGGRGGKKTTSGYAASGNAGAPGDY